MNKDEFLKTQETSLTAFNQEEKKDILYDYEEHFRIGHQNGKTDEELINELGGPDDIAKQYSGNIKRKKKSLLPFFIFLNNFLIKFTQCINHII